MHNNRMKCGTVVGGGHNDNDVSFAIPVALYFQKDNKGQTDISP